jgi:hypothetical protein
LGLREDHGSNIRVPDSLFACTLGTVHGSGWKIPSSPRTGSRPAAARIPYTPELGGSVPDRCGTRTTGGVPDGPSWKGPSGGVPVEDASPEVRGQAEQVLLPWRGQWLLLPLLG